MHGKCYEERIVGFTGAFNKCSGPEKVYQRKRNDIKG